MFEYYIVEKPRLTYESPEDGRLIRAFVRVLEGFLGRHEMEAHYQRLKAMNIDSKSFFREALHKENQCRNQALDERKRPLESGRRT